MDITQYKSAVIEHLRSGNASDAVWQEVGEQLLASSEYQPLLLDQELGFAQRCPRCESLVWIVDNPYPECPDCHALLSE